MLSVFMASIITLALGVVLVALGHRGRRVDDHPLCGGCGFDLFNKPSDSVRCPECGADVRSARAVKIGHRVRRRGPLIGGWCVTLAALFFLACFAYAQYSHFDLMPYKPMVMLRWEFAGPDAGASERALVEINRRLAAGKLGEADLAPIVEQVLIWQGDDKHAWRAAWGDLVEVARARKAVSAARWEKFLGQASRITVHVRKSLRHGSMTSGITVSTDTRLGSATRGSAPMEYQCQTSLDIACAGVRKRIDGGAISFHGSISHPLGYMLDFGTDWSRVGLGPQMLEVVCTTALRHVSGVSRVMRSAHSFNVTVLPPDQNPVRLTRAPALAAGMANGLDISSPPMRGWYSGWKVRQMKVPAAKPLAVLRSSNDCDAVVYETSPPPMAGVFRMEVVQGASRWPFTESLHLVPARERMPAFMFLDRLHVPGVLLRPGPAEIILTPDPQSAESDPDVEEIYGDEVRILITLIPREP
jgi:hypothetical protein